FRHEGQRNGQSCAAPKRRDPAPGLDGVADRSEVVAEPLRQRVEVLDDDRQAPEGGGLAGRPDDLQQRLADAEEPLTAPLPRLAHAPQLEADRLEVGEGRLEVGRGQDDVVDLDRAVGMARWWAGRSLAVGAQRPAGDAAARAGEPELGGADAAAVVV